MPAQPIQAEPQQAEPASAWAQDAQHYQKILRELADKGADIASLLHKRVRLLAAEPTMNTLLSEVHGPLSNLSPPLADPHNKSIVEASAAYDAAVRSTRRTIMLAEKLANPAPPTNPIPARQHIIRDEAAFPSKPANNDQQLQEHQAGQAETLQPERLDRPDPEDDLASRPIADFIAEILHDFSQLEASLLGSAAPKAPAHTPQTAATASSKPSAAIPLPFTSQPAPPSPPKPFPRL